MDKCPPDCDGRRHKENKKEEQNPNCKKKGTLMIGRGVEIGEWQEVRGHEGEWDAKKAEKAKQREKSMKGKGVRKGGPIV